MLRTTLAGLAAHKVRLLLTAMAIALGSGFVVGTLVLTDSMDQSFKRSFERSAHRVDVAVVPRQRHEELPAALLATVERVPGVTDVHGMVKGDAPLLGKNGRMVGDLPTLGISVPAGDLLRYELERGRAPTAPNEAVLDPRTAERAGFDIGSTVRVLDQRDRPHTFTITGIMDVGIDGEAAWRGAVGMRPDIARKLTGVQTVTEINVSGATEQAVAAAVGPEHQVLTGAELGEREAKRNGADTAVIRTGLLLFAAVALLVSALVIYNTFSILIAQRVREMALLRCVGATRRQVFRGVLVEAAVVGLVGAALGIGFGVLLGWGASVGMNALSPVTSIAGVTLTPAAVALGLAVGTVVTVASALLPARAATRVAPIAALRSEPEPGGGRFRPGPSRIAVTVLLAAVGLGATVYANLGMEPGESAMYLVALGGCVVFLAVIAMMPALVGPLGRLVGFVPARVGGVPGRLAVSNARRTPRRTATTTIALTVGVGLMTLFAVIGATTKADTERSMDRQFPVDYSIAPLTGSDGEGDTRRTVPASAVAALEARPELASVITERENMTTLASGDQAPVQSISEAAWGTVLRPTLTEGSLSAFTEGTALVVEGMLGDRSPGAGDTVTVPADPSAKRPERTVRVVGVLKSGETPFNGVILTEADFHAMFGAVEPVGVFVKAASGVTAAESRAAVEAALQAHPQLNVTSQAELKEDLNRSIDQMLMIFGGLLGLAIIIALFGIANTLTLSVVERTRESALLRAVGLTRRQLRRMLSIEALVMSVMGALTGAVLGCVYGWAATRAISEDIVFTVPYLQLAAFMALAALAGVAAAVLPARRAARASIVESLSHG